MVGSLSATGQEQTKVPLDTVRKMPQFFSVDLSLTQPIVLPARSPILPQQSFSDFIHQSLSTPMPSSFWTTKTSMDLTTSWQQELAKQNEYKTLRTILGSMQMGATAYLLYTHLKKYGLK
jgi:hypothetical protein